MLTPTASRELGRSFRFLRHARELTLRDVAKRSGMSPQYIQNIERGERLNASPEAYEKLASGYAVPLDVVLDLVLRARVSSALEQRGLDAESVAFVWRGVEQRLSERGVDLKTDISRVVASIIG